MDRKHPLRQHNIEDLLRPGRLSQAGFLGADEDLHEVISTDAGLLQDLGISHKQIAEALEQQIRRALNAETSKGRSGTTCCEWMGAQECPWDDGAATNKDYSFFHKDTERWLSFSGLLPHLITEHRFFEGKGTSYRLNPLEAILVLSIPSPKKSKDEIEDMLYNQYVLDMNSNYELAVEHALSGLDWFKDRPDYVQAVLKAVSTVSEKKKWHWVNKLIRLAKTVPEQTRAQVSEAILSLPDLIDKKTTDGKLALQSIRKFKREATGTTEPNILRGQYWSDLLEDAKEHNPDEAIQVCADYVRSRNLLFTEVCQRGTPFWNEYILETHSYERGRKTDAEIMASFKTFEGVVKDGSEFYFSMKEKLPYLKGRATNKQEIEKRLGFYEVFCDLAALHVAPIALAERLEERAKSLIQLERRSEAGEFISQAIKIYQAYAKHEPDRAQLYKEKITHLQSLS